MNGGICDSCKRLGKCEFTRNKPLTYTTYCGGYKPTVAITKNNPSDSDKLKRLRNHLDEVEKDIYKKLKNAEKDEEQYLLGIQSAIKEIKDWV